MSKTMILVAFLVVVTVGLGGYVLGGMHADSSKPKCKACKKCKGPIELQVFDNLCPCDAKKPAKPTTKKSPTKVKKRPTRLEKEAATLYLKWLQRCKNKHANPYGLHGCVLWQQLKKRHLKNTYADKYEIPRLQKALIVLGIVGKDVCEGGSKYTSVQNTKLLDNVNTLVTIVRGKLANIKRRMKSVKIPDQKLCVLRNGQMVWDYPLK